MTYGAPQDWPPGQQPGQQAPPPGYHAPMAGPGGPAQRGSRAPKVLGIIAGCVLVLFVILVAISKFRVSPMMVILFCGLALIFGIAALISWVVTRGSGAGPGQFGQQFPPQPPQQGYPPQQPGYPPSSGYQQQPGYQQPPNFPPYG